MSNRAFWATFISAVLGVGLVLLVAAGVWDNSYTSCYSHWFNTSMSVRVLDAECGMMPPWWSLLH